VSRSSRGGVGGIGPELLAGIAGAPMRPARLVPVIRSALLPSAAMGQAAEGGSARLVP
jgi:hypothetical protein